MHMNGDRSAAPRHGAATRDRATEWFVRVVGQRSVSVSRFRFFRFRFPLPFPVSAFRFRFPLPLRMLRGTGRDQTVRTSGFCERSARVAYRCFAEQVADRTTRTSGALFIYIYIYIYIYV
jgi:hypothetical protein